MPDSNGNSTDTDFWNSRKKTATPPPPPPSPPASGGGSSAPPRSPSSPPVIAGTTQETNDQGGVVYRAADNSIVATLLPSGKLVTALGQPASVTSTGEIAYNDKSGVRYRVAGAGSVITQGAPEAQTVILPSAPPDQTRAYRDAQSIAVRLWEEGRARSAASRDAALGLINASASKDAPLPESFAGYVVRLPVRKESAFQKNFPVMKEGFLNPAGAIRNQREDWAALWNKGGVYSEEVRIRAANRQAGAVVGVGLGLLFLKGGTPAVYANVPKGLSAARTAAATGEIYGKWAASSAGVGVVATQVLNAPPEAMGLPMAKARSDPRFLRATLAAEDQAPILGRVGFGQYSPGYKQRLYAELVREGVAGPDVQAYVDAGSYYRRYKEGVVNTIVAVRLEQAAEMAGPVIKSYVARRVGTGSNRLARFSIRAAAPVTLGFGEGAFGSLTNDVQSGRRPDAAKALGMGAFGSFTAGLLGGLNDRAVGYVLDPYEKPGDVIAALRVKHTGVRIGEPVYTWTWSPSGSEERSSSRGATMNAPSSGRARASSIMPASVGSRSIAPVPSRSVVPSAVPSRSIIPSFGQATSIAPVPSRSVVPSRVPSIVPSDAFTPSRTSLPSNTFQPSKTFQPSQTFVPSNTFVFTPSGTAVPSETGTGSFASTFTGRGLPWYPPEGRQDERGTSWRPQGLFRGFKYGAGLAAIQLGIKGRAIGGSLSGFEFRPLAEPRKRRGRPRRQKRW